MQKKFNDVFCFTFGDVLAWHGNHTLENNLSCREFSMYLDSLRILPFANLPSALFPQVLAKLGLDNIGCGVFVRYEVEVDGSIILCDPTYPDIMQCMIMVTENKQLIASFLAQGWT